MNKNVPMSGFKVSWIMKTVWQCQKSIATGDRLFSDLLRRCSSYTHLGVSKSWIPWVR